MHYDKAKSQAAVFFSKTLTVLIVSLNIIAALALIMSAYAGTIDPAIKPVIGVMPMFLPFAALAMLFMLIIDLIAWRRTAIFAGAVMMICLPQVLQVFPMHIMSHEPKNATEKARVFSLLSMNIIDFNDLTGEYPGDINPTISFILSTDADVVCMQEVEYFSKFDQTHITQEQIDSLNSRYPYSVRQDYLMILSKYNVTPLDVHLDNGSYGAGDMAAYRIYVNDQPLTIFNVHLRSFRLNNEDRAVLQGLTHINRERISFLRHQVLTKLAEASVDRARQADRLVQYLKHYGGTNVIVCGDFNDVPTCYTMRELREQNLEDVQASIGFGYKHTYNRNRFYFTIDHIMYRGNLEPINICREKIPYSDHYPLLATFLFN